MDGEQFYENFKDALRFFGLVWADMGLVKVNFRYQTIIFSYGGKEIRYHE